MQIGDSSGPVEEIGFLVRDIEVLSR